MVIGVTSSARRLFAYLRSLASFRGYGGFERESLVLLPVNTPSTLHDGFKSIRRVGAVIVSVKWSLWHPLI